MGMSECDNGYISGPIDFKNQNKNIELREEVGKRKEQEQDHFLQHIRFTNNARTTEVD